MAATNTSTPNKQPELYVLGRDSAESQRLNTQHEFIKATCDGRLLLGSMPRKSILNVADVGCGTGIWLKDVESELSVIPTAHSQERHFHGFDISDAQFPPDHSKRMVFTVHDVLKPFPEEEKGSYDIVQVRLLLWGLKEVDISTAVQNVVQLLRPGGYLQWVDIEMELGTDSSPEFRTTYELLLGFSKSQGVSNRFCSVVKESCEKLGLEDIELTDLAPAEKPHLQKTVQDEFLHVMQAAVPPILLRSGEAKTMGDAKEMFASGMRKEIEEKFSKGEVPTYPIVSVVAKMPA